MEIYLWIAICILSCAIVAWVIVSSFKKGDNPTSRNWFGFRNEEREKHSRRE